MGQWQTDADEKHSGMPLVSETHKRVVCLFFSPLRLSISDWWYVASLRQPPQETETRLRGASISDFSLAALVHRSSAPLYGRAISSPHFCLQLASTKSAATVTAAAAAATNPSTKI